MLRYFTRLILIFLAISLTPGTVRAAEQDLMIVLDASGSMWGQIDGVSKIEIAREVMGLVLTDLDGKADIGVITYGHRKKGDCRDIETIIPVGKVDRAGYMARINALSPKGKTPISDAVRAAAEQLRFTENRATVVLVSDGLETCGADPCALARELESKGIDFTVHVVGFDLKGKDTSSLQCLARQTGGMYLAADNADQLGDAVGTVVATAPETAPEPEPAPEPAATPTLLKVDVRLAPGSEPIDNAYVYVVPEAGNRKKANATTSGSIRNPFKLEAGKYYLETRVGTVTGTTDVEVKENTENTAGIILNAGLLTVKAVQQEGAEPIEQAYIHIDEPELQTSGKRKRVTSGNQRNTFTLAAGKYYAIATHGKASVGQEVEVKAGERTDAVIVLAAGMLQVQVLATEGGKPKIEGTYVYIDETEVQANGKRKRITGAVPRKPFSLPAGTYFVTAKIGNATASREFEVTAGKLNQATIILGFGAMKATVVPAEGGKPLDKAFITIHELEKQLDGKRNRITSANQRKTFKLSAGKYLVTAKLDSALVTTEVEITAGKRIEPVINLNAGALSITGAGKIHVTIFAAEKNLDGTRDRITSFRPRKPVMLPAGNYIVSGKQDGEVIEVEAEVKAGKLTEVKLLP